MKKVENRIRQLLAMYAATEAIIIIVLALGIRHAYNSSYLTLPSSVSGRTYTTRIASVSNTKLSTTRDFFAITVIMFSKSECRLMAREDTSTQRYKMPRKQTIIIAKKCNWEEAQQLSVLEAGRPLCDVCVASAVFILMMLNKKHLA